MFVDLMNSCVICVILAGTAMADGLPSDVLDLSNWRLTLPVDTDREGKPDEIRQPELKSFVDPNYFYVPANETGVAFRAHCGGETTKGSGFPRCELRETNAKGTERADWSTDDDELHVMEVSLAITATPPVKQHVVCAQIHDADDDLLMIRLEGKKLFIERNELETVMLDREYKLGTRFDLRIQAGDGKVGVWYNGENRLDWPVSRKGCYFKAGCYTQSNVGKGDAATSFGEVVIYKLDVKTKD